MPNSVYNERPFIERPTRSSQQRNFSYTIIPMAVGPSGQVFSDFTSSEHKGIWKRLKRRKDIILSLHTFFQDMWYLEVCANYIKHLINLC
jgi:hypothetical protein